MKCITFTASITVSDIVKLSVNFVFHMYFLHVIFEYGSRTYFNVCVFEERFLYFSLIDNSEKEYMNTIRIGMGIHGSRHCGFWDQMEEYAWDQGPDD